MRYAIAAYVILFSIIASLIAATPARDESRERMEDIALALQIQMKLKNIKPSDLNSTRIISTVLSQSGALPVQMFNKNGYLVDEKNHSYIVMVSKDGIVVIKDYNGKSIKACFFLQTESDS